MRWRGALILLGLALAPAPGPAEPLYVESYERVRTSPGGVVTARYAVSRDRAWLELSRGGAVFHTITFEGRKDGPADHHVFDDGTLITAERATGRDSDVALTARDPSGRIRWTRTLRELLPSRDYFHVVIDGQNYWYKSAKLEGDPRRGTAQLRFTLVNRDELTVAVADGAIARRKVPVAELGDDARALKDRANHLDDFRDTAEKEALLRRVFDANPGDLDAAHLLASLLSYNKRFEEAVQVWRRYRRPPRDPDEPIYAGEVDTASYELTAALIAAGSHREALDVVSAALAQRPDNNKYELQLGEIHLRLGDVDRARAIFDELLRRKERQIAAKELVFDDFGHDEQGLHRLADRMRWLFEVTGHPDLAQHYRAEGDRRAKALLKKAPPPEHDGDWYTRIKNLLDAGAIDDAIAAWEAMPEQQRSAEIAHRIGAFYLEGELVPRNLALALEWYTRAAQYRTDYRSEDTYFTLCYLHRHARAKPNYRAAARWCERASNAGDRAGMFWLAILHASGQGVARDDARAAQLLAAARAKGYVGSGTSPKPYLRSTALVPDFQWAAKVLEPLAARGVAVAEATLGELYGSAFLGPLRDEKKRLAYYERAAHHGDGPSMLEFARLAPGSSCAQYEWLEKAVAAGEKYGHYQIAECHVRGRVKSPSLATAEKELRAYTLQYYEEHPPDEWKYGRERLPAESLYAELEKALGHPVERPTPPSHPDRR